MPQAQQQDNWRFCQKCYALFWNGMDDNGHCPAGGSHDASDSWNYTLTAESGETVSHHTTTID